MFYYGWKISYIGGNGSQRWIASRYGVTMCANTKDLLINMIDARRKDKRFFV